MRGDSNPGAAGWRAARLGAAALLAATLACACAPGTRRASTESDPLNEGWERYRFGEFDSAIRAFELVSQQAAPSDPRGLQARYGLGTTWCLRTPAGDQDKARATAYFQEIIALAPDSDLAAWSLLALARMQHLVPVGSEPDFAAVRNAYRACIERFPEHLAGHEAFIYLQSTYVQLLEEEPAREAAAALTAFIEQHPDSGFLSGAWLLLASCHDTMRQPQAQLHAELRALENMEFDPANPKQEKSGAYWRIATIAEFEAGDFDTARRFYRLLATEYPQDNRVYAAEEAIGRMDGVEADIRRTLFGGGT